MTVSRGNMTRWNFPCVYTPRQPEGRWWVLIHSTNEPLFMLIWRHVGDMGSHWLEALQLSAIGPPSGTSGTGPVWTALQEGHGVILFLLFSLPLGSRNPGIRFFFEGTTVNFICVSIFLLEQKDFCPVSIVQTDDSEGRLFLLLAELCGTHFA
jgi:hypothetical protein